MAHHPHRMMRRPGRRGIVGRDPGRRPATAPDDTAPGDARSAEELR
jgi:hypothetical protein